MAQAAATAAITNARLAVGTVTTQNSATVAAGSVISQRPTAGTSAAPGSAVTLVVSSGPAPPVNVSVPNVVGLARAVATTRITTAGLTVGTVTTQISATVPAGGVISQRPAAGAGAAPGSAVNLVVSSGPDTPPPAGTALLFSDNFSDSRANGDSNWRAVSGKWTGNASVLSSSTTSDNKALVRDVSDLDPFVVGRLQTDLKLSRARGANGAIIFGYQDSSHYRYVRLYSNKVVIGQVGSFDGERSGIKATAYGRFATSAWHTLQVDVYNTGRVSVYVDKEEYVRSDDDDDEKDDDRDSGASASHRFRSVSTGSVGYSAVRTSTLFDNFFAWDGTVLPSGSVDDHGDDDDDHREDDD